MILGCICGGVLEVIAGFGFLLFTVAVGAAAKIKSRLGRC